MRFRELLEDITPQEAGSFVNFVKNAFGSKKIETRVTGHFLEGLNNPRNKPPITNSEIISVIKKLLKQHGESIKEIPAGKNATIVDQQTNINIPIVFEDPRKDEFDARIVLKTVQRKKEYRHYDLPIILEAVGRITKQNQTQDVGPDEVKKQAAKFGNTVDKDGRPPTLSKKTKGSKTNVLFNLGLTESILDELNIPRNQMPQISMKDLKGGYDLEPDIVDPSTLETSQDQRIPGMVDKTVKSIENGFNKPLVVDKNGFIVNGHHRYDAYLKLGVSKVPVIRVKDASIEELVRDFAHTAKDTYAENDIIENFADGKKKGKSRPGRFKKAGVSCKGSVTDLRKKAKNSSGEKQKGYHWCANMKSGRKKS